MQVTITQIGNSKGIRIPQAILKQLDLKDTATLVVEQNMLIIKPTSPRNNWPAQFTQAKPTPTTIEYVENQWDQEEWRW